MATMWTPPIDLYEEDREPATSGRDDREMGFTLTPDPTGLQTHPRENGDWDDTAVHAGEERWGSVLGW